MQTTRQEKRTIYRPEGALDRSDFVESSLLRGKRLTRYLLRVLRGTGGVICGGYARWAASTAEDPVEPGDVDVFCRDEAALCRVRAALERFGHGFVRENPVSYVYAGHGRELFGLWRQACPPVNVVKPLCEGAIRTQGDAWEILHNFDLTVSKAAILDETTALVHFAFAEDEKRGRIRFTRIHTPVSGLLRTFKYVRKGYTISLRETMLLLRKWDEEKLDYRQVAKQISHAKPSNSTSGCGGSVTFMAGNGGGSTSGHLEFTRLLSAVDVDEEPSPSESYCYMLTGARRWRRKRAGGRK